MDFSADDQGLPIPQRVDAELPTSPDADLSGILFPGIEPEPDLPRIETNGQVLLLDLTGRRSANWDHLRHRLAQDEYELTVEYQT